MGQQAMLRGRRTQVLEPCLRTLSAFMSPGRRGGQPSSFSNDGSFGAEDENSYEQRARVDSVLVGWLLLYLSACLSAVPSARGGVDVGGEPDGGAAAGTGQQATTSGAGAASKPSDSAGSASSSARSDSWLCNGAVRLGRKNLRKGMRF